MILKTFKIHPETSGKPYRPKAFRWSIELSLSLPKKYFSIGLVNQYQSRETEEWHESHVGNWEFYITDYWAWGSKHYYYDGPHCSFHVGPVAFYYPAKGGWCTKCMPD